MIFEVRLDFMIQLLHNYEVIQNEGPKVLVWESLLFATLNVRPSQKYTHLHFD